MCSVWNGLCNSHSCKSRHSENYEGFIVVWKFIQLFNNVGQGQMFWHCLFHGIQLGLITSLCESSVRNLLCKTWLWFVWTTCDINQVPKQNMLILCSSCFQVAAICMEQYCQLVSCVAKEYPQGLVKRVQKIPPCINISKSGKSSSNALFFYVSFPKQYFRIHLLFCVYFPF